MAKFNFKFNEGLGLTVASVWAEMLLTKEQIDAVERQAKLSGKDFRTVIKEAANGAVNAVIENAPTAEAVAEFEAAEKAKKEAEKSESEGSSEDEGETEGKDEGEGSEEGTESASGSTAKQGRRGRGRRAAEATA